MVRDISHRRFPDLFRELWRVLNGTATSMSSAIRRRRSSLKADSGSRRIQVLEVHRVGQGGNQHGLSLPCPPRTHSLSRERQAKPETTGARPNIITARAIRRGYPTEKPVSVSEVLIRQSSRFGEIVADPFMGSGSVGVATIQLGRRFLGNDKSRKAVAFATRRLRSCMKSAGGSGLVASQLQVVHRRACEGLHAPARGQGRSGHGPTNPGCDCWIPGAKRIQTLARTSTT